ncbi:MAG: hypothetical protein ACFFE8_10865 [Candidatus Heimdallarchaeota archaeon]
MRKIPRLKFHDGRIDAIEKDRLIQFEIRSVLDRFYSNRTLTAAKVLNDIGSVHVDYTNIQDFHAEIPDIDPRSARLFTLWAEEIDSKDIALILRGFFILVPFDYSKEALTYYYHHEAPSYPMALITAFRTIYDEVDTLVNVIDQVKDTLLSHWQSLRTSLINTLRKTKLWERYVLSLDQLIYYSFLIPSVDRELISALKRKNHRTTGIMQILASQTPSYDQIQIENHLEEAKKIIDKHRSS